MLGVVKFSLSNSVVLLCDYKNHSPVKYMAVNLQSFISDTGINERTDIFGVEIKPNQCVRILIPHIISFKNLLKLSLSVNDMSEMNSVYSVISVKDYFRINGEQDYLSFGSKHVKYGSDFKTFREGEVIFEIFKVLTSIRGSLLNDVEYIVVTKRDNILSYYEITDLSRGVFGFNKVCSCTSNSLKLIVPSSVK